MRSPAYPSTDGSTATLNWSRIQHADSYTVYQKTGDGDYTAVRTVQKDEPLQAELPIEQTGCILYFTVEATANFGNQTFEMARDLRFIVSGPAEPERAQVTRGGLLTEQFDPSTLEARALPGFFACGEALNVDGACGGFNLAWAWKSGIVAGRAAATATGRCI